MTKQKSFLGVQGCFMQNFRFLLSTPKKFHSDKYKIDTSRMVLFWKKSIFDEDNSVCIFASSTKKFFYLLIFFSFLLLKKTDWLSFITFILKVLTYFPESIARAMKCRTVHRSLLLSSYYPKGSNSHPWKKSTQVNNYWLTNFQKPKST